MSRINMIYPRLLERNGSGRLTLGGVQTYIQRLSELAADMGHTPVLYQQADTSFTCTSGPLLVRGIAPANSPIRRLHKIACQEHSAENPVVVFCADQCSCATRSRRSLAIQHGVHWDLPLRFWGLKGARRVLWPLYRYYALWVKKMTFERARFRVCVDLNFINWYRTISHKDVLPRIYYIPNCCTVADHDIVTRRLALRPHTVRVLFARRLEEYRGTRIFVSAVQRLLAQKLDVQIIVAGEGPDEQLMRARLADAQQVTFSKVSPAEMIELLKTIDIAVVPSLASEGTSFSLVEAMGAGCACIATNVGGMTNMVIDRYNGLMIWPSADALYHAMRSLIIDADTRARLSWAAWETARQAFSEEGWRKAWSKLFTIVLSA